jgi:hypothetical protein
VWVTAVEQTGQMQRVFILDYQLQVELVGPVRIGDHVCWEVGSAVGDFYGDADEGLGDARYFEGDQALEEEDDEPAGTVIAGKVTEIRGVWSQRDSGGVMEPMPGTARTMLGTEANHWQRNKTPGPNLTFEGYLLAIE